MFALFWYNLYRGEWFIIVCVQHLIISFASTVMTWNRDVIRLCYNRTPIYDPYCWLRFWCTHIKGHTCLTVFSLNYILFFKISLETLQIVHEAGNPYKLLNWSARKLFPLYEEHVNTSSYCLNKLLRSHPLVMPFAKASKHAESTIKWSGKART